MNTSTGYRNASPSSIPSSTSAAAVVAAAANRRCRHLSFSNLVVATPATPPHYARMACCATAGLLRHGPPRGLGAHSLHVHRLLVLDPFAFNAHYMLRKDSSGKMKVMFLGPPNKNRSKKIWVAKSLVEKVKAHHQVCFPKHKLVTS